jgi:hypothetical protein
MTSVELLGAVTPIHMVGESHSLVFSNLLFRAAGCGDAYLCRTRFLPLLAADYSDGANIHADYANALLGEGIVDQAFRPAFMNADPAAAFLAGTPLMAPPMVLFAGDMDLHQLFPQMAEFDFLLEDDPHYGVDKARQLLSYADVRDHISSVLAPFLATVEQLRDVGFNRLMIHCLPPRTRDNEAASRWTGGTVVDAPVRAKLTLAANRLIQAFCDRAAIPFIDTWPELTIDGYLRPEFELDGVHVNRASAMVSLAKIASNLCDRTTRIWNIPRYESAVSQADRRRPPAPPSRLDAQWRDAGLVHASLDASFIEKAATGLSSAWSHENPHARPDWIGWPSDGCPGMASAEPDSSWLADGALCLDTGEARDLLHAGSAHELTIASFRPVRYAAGAEGIQPLPSPPGTRRALILPSPTDRVAFESVEGGMLLSGEIAAGSCIVYDPQRVAFQLRSGKEDVELIELALLPRLAGQPFRVARAGLCDWPADPYAFNVSGMKAFPPFDGPAFRARAL